MSIITKPTNISKGISFTISLNKSQLADLSSDSYYSNVTNWKQVLLYYKSTSGNQQKIVKFDAAEDTPSGTFFASAKAKDSFQIQYVLIKDFDGGLLEIPRSSLVSVEFDINFPVPQSIQWVNPALNVYNIEADGGLTNGVNRGTEKDVGITADSQQLSGDFEIEFTLGLWGWGNAVGLVDVNDITKFDGLSSTGAGPSASFYKNSELLGAAPISGMWFFYINENETNFLKITRVGTLVSIYYNNVVIHSYNSSKIYKPYASLCVPTWTPGEGVGGQGFNGTLVSAIITQIP